MTVSHGEFPKRLHIALDLAGVDAGRGRVRKLSEMYGVSRETARKWLAGLALPETERLLDMATRFGVGFEWLVTEDSTTGDTGHVMVVLDAPRPNATRNGEWLVQVADSTLSPHALDSRHQGETGLGTGTIGLVVDANGGPVAFYWKGGISEHAKPTEIALGEPA